MLRHQRNLITSYKILMLFYIILLLLLQVRLSGLWCSWVNQFSCLYVKSLNIILLIFRQLYPDKKENFDKLRQELLETSNEMAPLKVWQFQELSLQAAQRVVSAPEEEALNVLTHIAQNFPMQVGCLKIWFIIVLFILVIFSLIYNLMIILCGKIKLFFLLSYLCVNFWLIIVNEFLLFWTWSLLIKGLCNFINLKEILNK